MSCALSWPTTWLYAFDSRVHCWVALVVGFSYVVGIMLHVEIRILCIGLLDAWFAVSVAFKRIFAKVVLSISMKVTRLFKLRPTADRIASFKASLIALNSCQTSSFILGWSFPSSTGLVFLANVTVSHTLVSVEKNFGYQVAYSLKLSPMGRLLPFSTTFWINESRLFNRSSLSNRP
jgi:hypothetical protein